MKQTKPNTLLNLIDYTVRQNPRGVMQLGNKYGELPYNYKIPIRVYLESLFEYSQKRRRTGVA